MANTIQHKRSSTSGVAPVASGLSQGELAINIADGKLYTKNSSNAVINLGVTSISGTYITPSSGNFFNYLAVNGIPVSISGHSHLSVPQAQSLVTTVFNKTASTIPKFSAVYIDGGQGDQPTIRLAIAAGEGGSSRTYGITAEAITSMNTGAVIVAGALSGVNTDAFNPTAPVGDVNGSALYLSPTVSGGLTTTKPYAPNHLVYMATIVRTHQNEGVVEVRVQNGYELEELHNVAISGVADGQFLQYNSGSGLWVPSSSGNFSSLSVNNTGVSLNGHTHSSSDITNFNSAVSGLLPTISNSGDNRVLTSTGSSVGINAESDLTFDGTSLSSPRLIATQASADEGGELQLAKAPNSSISGAIIIDAYQNRLRFFEQSGSNRGFYLDLSAAGAGVSTNIGGGGSATTVSNYADNRIITSDGTTTGLNAESNFTFNGSLLNVVGSGSFSNNVTASGFIRTGGTSSQFLKADGSVDSTSYQSSLTNPVTGTGIASHIAYWNSSSGITADNSQLYWDATNNRLGINTNSPAASLDIRGSAVFNENGADADFRIEGDADANLVFVDASTDRVGIGYNTPTTKLQVNGTFSCGGGGAGDPSSGGQGLYVDPVTPLLRFNDSGPNYVADIDVNGLTLYDIGSVPFFYTDRANARIGIGTSTPSAALDINGSFKSLGFNSYGISWFGSSDGSIGIGINNNPSGTFGSASAFAAFQGFNDGISSYNAICFTTLYAPQLYLNTDGNVGIGTATPSAKLDVTGDVNIDGNLILNNNTSLSESILQNTINSSNLYLFANFR